MSGEKVIEMGWDLYARKKGVYWGTNAFCWRHWIGHALEFSGADMKSFSQYNMGDYVPARVARAWADTLEDNLADLRLAAFKSSTFLDGEAAFIVGRRTTEKRVTAIAKAIIGGHGEYDYEFVGFRELSGEDRKYLKQFVRFCRRSSGFWQW
jgi:hypothetical protein